MDRRGGASPLALRRTACIASDTSAPLLTLVFAARAAWQANTMDLYISDPEAALRIRRAGPLPHDQRLPYRLFSPEVLASYTAVQNPPTKTLDGREALQIAQRFWEDGGGAALLTEAPGPPCARCDEPHMSSECTGFLQPRGSAVTDWLGVHALDGFMAAVARAMQAAADGKGGALQYALVNSLYSDEEGAPGGHWVAAVFEVAPVPG